jgi:hypothetical protein
VSYVNSKPTGPLEHEIEVRPPFENGGIGRLIIQEIVEFVYCNPPQPGYVL